MSSMRWAFLSSSPLRRRSVISGRIKRKISRALGGSESWNCVLFNDRYGMHRIYYHQSKDAFYFAAEAKAILAVRPDLRRMDSRGLGEFVSCGAVLENRTIFEGIHVLPPASAWVFRNGSLEQKRHAISIQGSGKNRRRSIRNPAIGNSEQTFTRNLPRYFAGRERIGMSLTGGLDTRMILACRKPDPGSLPCYTFGSMFRENQDVRVARRVAEICNQPHQIITAGQEFLSQFPRYAERAVYLTDGCVDVGRAPDLYLNERAREIAPVRMTGNYGGEVLRGVRAFKPVEPPEGLFSPAFLSNIRRAAETYQEVLQGQPDFFCRLSARFRGVSTVCWHSSRHSFPCGLLTLTTTLSVQCFDRRRRLSRATRFLCD